jgi:hypothetical protein
MTRLTNYLREAFKLPINLAFLAGTGLVAAASAAVAIVIPPVSDAAVQVMFFSLLTGGALEALYLYYMTGNTRFRKAVDLRKRESHQRLSAQFSMLRQISQGGANLLRHFARFNQQKENLVQNLLKQNERGANYTPDFFERLDLLEVQYIQHHYDIWQYEQVVSQQTRTQLQDEIRRLRSEAQTAPERLQPALHNRLTLLQKRLQRQDELHETVAIARVQLANIEDTLSYLTEQSLANLDAAELTRVINNLIGTSETHYETQRDIADIFGHETIIGSSLDDFTNDSHWNNQRL